MIISHNRKITRTFTVSFFCFVSTGAGVEIGRAVADGANVTVSGVDVDGAITDVNPDGAGTGTGLLEPPTQSGQ